MYVSFRLIKNTIIDLNYSALQNFLLISLYLNSVIQLTSLSIKILYKLHIDNENDIFYHLTFKETHNLQLKKNKYTVTT